MSLAIYLIVGGCVALVTLSLIELRRYLHLKQRVDALKNEKAERDMEKERAQAVVNFGMPVLTRHNWAEFEANVDSLEQVIVVSDVVERPENSVLNAVIGNFHRGVKYTFLVSNSKAALELHGYVEVFRGLAQTALALTKKKVDADKLVTIKALPDEWANAPFVFYRTRSPDSGQMLTIAFHGNQRGSGISDFYIPMHPDAADALATALVSGSPEDIRIEMHEFQNDAYSVSETIDAISKYSRVPTPNKISKNRMN